MTPQSDEDEVWRQIVASYHTEETSADKPWPDRENVPDQPVAISSEPLPAGPSGDEPEDHSEDPDDPDDPDDEDHYIPPPPPPLPETDAGTKIAWLALFGGPAYLLLAALLSWPMQGWILFAAVGAFIGGFVALVVRMGDGPPKDSGWDDGAVI
ncbi:MAG TPA: hypothetical protein VIR33_18460 [Thermopolyspora sp.]